MSDTCRSCDAPVMWLENETTGKRAPIDREPTEGGNIEIDQAAGRYRVLLELERPQAQERGAPLHMNHFATCPQARNWKRGKR
jgi:uncharacterized protein involved in high-affinity Fe2+ transport